MSAQRTPTVALLVCTAVAYALALIGWMLVPPHTLSATLFAAYQLGAVTTYRFAILR